VAVDAEEPLHAMYGTTAKNSFMPRAAVAQPTPQVNKKSEKK
jgi:hypothetical protein